MATVIIPNPPSNITPQDFRSSASRFGGLAKVAKYIVRFPDRLLRLNTPSTGAGGYDYIFRDLSLLCEAAEFPSRGFISGDFRYYGPNFKIPFQTQYEDLNLTFLCRDDFREREMFDAWMELINPTTTYDFAYRDSYSTTIEIFQMSDIGVAGQERATYKISFQKAYPILLSAQQVTWADENYNRLTVTFTYINWKKTPVDTLPSSAFDLIRNGDIQRTGGTVISNEFSGEIAQPRTADRSQP